MNKQIRITIISIITGILVMSCNLISHFPGLTKNVPTSTAIPVSVPEVIVAEPTIIISDNSIAITFSEGDVLSWIQQYQEANPEVGFKDPTVTLDDGVCQITGVVDSGLISGEVTVVFSVGLSQDNMPVIAIEKMQLGGMELPQSLKDQFSSAINRSIVDAMQNELGGKSIQSVTIDDGVMSILATS